MVVDANGTPLAILLTAANANDVTQLLPLVDAIPPVRGKPGAPRRKPTYLLGDRGYDSNPHRSKLRERGILPMIARRREAHGSGLGVFRYVVEQSIGLLHQFRRLKLRYDKRDDIHGTFLTIAEAFICWRRLRHAKGYF